MGDLYDARDGQALMDYVTFDLGAGKVPKQFPSLINSLSVFVADDPGAVEVSFNGASWQKLAPGIMLKRFAAPDGFWARSATAQSVTFLFGRATITDYRQARDYPARTKRYPTLANGYNPTLVYAGRCILNTLIFQDDASAAYLHVYDLGAAPDHAVDLPAYSIVGRTANVLDNFVPKNQLFENGIGFVTSTDLLLTAPYAGGPGGINGSSTIKMKIDYTPLI